MSEVSERLAAVLAEHAWQDDTAPVGKWAALCACNRWRGDGPIYSLRARHDSHRAEALAERVEQMLAEARAEALREAAAEVALHACDGSPESCADDPCPFVETADLILARADAAEREAR